MLCAVSPMHLICLQRGLFFLYNGRTCCVLGLLNKDLGAGFLPISAEVSVLVRLH
jgi:hypothetical protein